HEEQHRFRTELRRKRATWRASKNIKEVRKADDARLSAHASDSAPFLAFPYASDNWNPPKQDRHANNVIQCDVERTFQRISRFS
ncbi:hypothetical protein V3C99_002902, partial [Haemonchus contortus]